MMYDIVVGAAMGIPSLFQDDQDSHEYHPSAYFILAGAEGLLLPTTPMFSVHGPAAGKAAAKIKRTSVTTFANL